VEGRHTTHGGPVTTTRLSVLAAALCATACADPSADSFAPGENAPALGEVVAPAACPTLTIADLRPGDIVITEFMADAYSSDQEWIELHNRLPCEVSLSGARLETYTFDLLGRAAVIPPRGYLTLSYLDRADGLGFEPDVSFVSINFHTSSDTIVLRTSTMVIDSVVFDWSDWIITAFEARSLSLNRTDTHARANDFPANWCHADRFYGTGWDGDYYGTPGAPNRPCTGTLTDFDNDGEEHEWAGGGDCDDDNPKVNPSAIERCGDGIDNDCDGLEDCEDDGCYGIPPCEGCSDGRDEDGDGLIDCDDPDCDGDPACLELDCSDGADDDGDGLVDCEDGDCSESPLCVELDCSDGLDSDTDGLIDCEDDDCWGADCHPGGTRARVLGGNFQRVRARTRKAVDTPSYHGGPGCDYWRDFASDSTIWATAVVGTVQVLPDGISSWSATTARSTCTWSAAATTAYHEYGARTGGGTWAWLDWDLERSGVNLAPGCRLRADTFLPGDLFYRNQVFWGAYDVMYGSTWLGTLREPWFMLKTTTSVASSGHPRSSSSACGSQHSYTWNTWWQGSLGSSATSGMYAPGW
jgi:hypothetical protein